MRMVKCDRCGSLVDERNADAIDFNFDDIKYEPPSAVLYKRHSVDLCTECQRIVYFSIINKEKKQCITK